jgi:hypothetical protein
MDVADRKILSNAKWKAREEQLALYLPATITEALSRSRLNSRPNLPRTCVRVCLRAFAKVGSCNGPIIAAVDLFFPFRSSAPPPAPPIPDPGVRRRRGARVGGGGVCDTSAHFRLLILHSRFNARPVDTICHWDREN